MEAWNGEVINLTGKDIIIVNGVRTPYRTYRAKEAAVQIDVEEVFLGLLNGQIELAYEKVCGLRGLPPPQLKPDGVPKCYYLVSKRVVMAAAQLQRSLVDLLIPHRAVQLSAGKTPYAEAQFVYQGLMPARYWYDLRRFMGV